jgi:phosphoribosylamine---glycine ligase
MRILFISEMLIGADIARHLQEEGNEVRLYINDERFTTAFENIVPKVKKWEDSLDWVGKDGLIIFDDVGFGKKQDELRKEGYTVFGGSAEGERLEIERAFAQKIFAHCGLKVPATFDFTSISDAKHFIEGRPRAWVLKFQGHLQKHLAFIGNEHNGSDVLSALLAYEDIIEQKEDFQITIQERLFGIEIGVGRFFNGEKWIGPIEYNIEHPRLYPQNIGPIVDEMGTLAWYRENENEKLFRTLLLPLTEYLRASDFRGDFSINSIVNEEGIFPIEATTRFGSPIVHLQTTLHKEGWASFLHAIARKEDYTLSYSQGFGVVIFGALPPFPYSSSHIGKLSTHMPIFFDKTLSESEKKRIHFEEMSLIKANGSSYYYATGPEGYCLYTTGKGKSVENAQKNALRVMKKIHLHKLFYRPDIGNDFIKWQREALLKYGIDVPLDLDVEEE